MVLLLNLEIVLLETLEAGAREIARALGVERRHVGIKAEVGLDGLLRPRVDVPERVLLPLRSEQDARDRIEVIYRVIKMELNDRRDGVFQRRPRAT